MKFRVVLSYVGNLRSDKAMCQKTKKSKKNIILIYSLYSTNRTILKTLDTYIHCLRDQEGGRFKVNHLATSEHGKR